MDRDIVSNKDRARWWWNPTRIVVAATSLVFLLGAGLALSDRIAGSDHSFYYLFATQELPAAILGIGILLGGYLIAVRYPSLPSYVRLPGAVFDRPRALFVLVFVALCAGAFGVYRAFPLSMDEYAPVFQARIFAEGELFGRFPPDLVERLIYPQFIDYFFLYDPSTGEVASKYWPGHALLLTPFTWLGAPWLLNPLLGAAGILLLRHLARELFDEKVARWATVLALISPAFWAYAISFYSMTAHLVVNLGFACLVLKPTPLRCFSAGLVGSLGLVLHQPVPHALFALPWLAYFLYRRRFRELASLSLGYLPVTMLIGIGWIHLRAGISAEWEQHALLHDISIAPDPPYRSESAFPVVRLAGAVPNIFHDRWGTGSWVEVRSQLKMWLWCVPGLPLLAGVGAWFARRRHPLVWLPAASFLVTLLFFFFVPMDQGHGWGYRYIHSAWWALPLYGAACLASDRFHELRHHFVPILVLTALVFLPIRLVQVKTFVEKIRVQRPFTDIEGPAVVFIDTRTGFYRQDLLRNDPFLREDVVVLTAEEPESDEKLARSLLVPPVRRIQRDADTAWLGEELVLPKQISLEE